MQLLFVVWFGLALGGFVFAQPNPYWQDVHIFGRLTPPFGRDVDITVVAGEKRAACFPWNKPDAALCTASVFVWGQCRW
jgi:hypothetical protein